MLHSHRQKCSLRALLIQEGVKPGTVSSYNALRLRALLIQEGVKHKILVEGIKNGLRALLIQEGVKLWINLRLCRIV